MSGPPGKPDGFVPVTPASELAPGSMRWVVVDRQRVLLANVEGVVYALHDMCGHRGAPLSTGSLTGHVVECPLHYACFDVRTGKLLSGPVSADVATYEVRVEDDTVYVKR
jgi:nitrite reductase/ring-hydroxylating ferredoxin subunit